MQLLGIILASESWEPKIKYEKFGAHFEDFPALEEFHGRGLGRGSVNGRVHQF